MRHKREITCLLATLKKSTRTTRVEGTPADSSFLSALIRGLQRPPCVFLNFISGQPVLQLNVIGIAEGHVFVAGVISLHTPRLDPGRDQFLRKGGQGRLGGGRESQVVEANAEL